MNQRSIWHELLPALIGLSGVLVGSFVSIGAQALLDERNRDRGKREEVTQAQRLVALEVFEAANDIQALKNQTGWDSRVVAKSYGPVLQSSAWEEYAPMLARYLSEDRWQDLSIFYANVSRFRALLLSYPVARGIIRDALLLTEADAQRLAKELGVRVPGADLPPP